MSKTRTEMYQTVRDALTMPCTKGCRELDQRCRKCKALEALDALEAQEREAPKYASQIPEKYDPEKSYLPAPPAAECAVRKAVVRLDLLQRENSLLSRSYLSEAWIELRVALASPCSEGLRDSFDVEERAHVVTMGQRDTLATELAAAKSEIARLTTDRDEAVAKARRSEERLDAYFRADPKQCAAGMSNETLAGLLQGARGDLAAELRQAVDALMETALPLETIGNEIRASERAHPQMCIELQAAVLRAQDRVREFVAAYDAKHGEAENASSV